MCACFRAHYTGSRRRIAEFLHHLGFRSTSSDASLFVYHMGDATTYLLLYVDDIILIANTSALLQQLTDRLRAEFALKDLGPLHYFLGIEVVRRLDGFFLHHKKYAHELLDRAEMLNFSPVSTPVDTKAKLSATDGSPAPDASLYWSIVGALQYLTPTRPELQHYRLFGHGLGRLPRHAELHFGYCVYLGPSLISWSSKRQPTVSRSNVEADYRVVANAVAECSWLRQLLRELSYPVDKATVVYYDNVSAVYLSANPVHHR
uniref:Uncharacterized protein n=1 Tax=Avena sativa TaxID=4498 RepID=A0ACD5YA54_AVESA